MGALGRWLRNLWRKFLELESRTALRMGRDAEAR